MEAIELEIILPGTPWDAWHWWADAGQRARWWSPEVELMLEEGGSFSEPWEDAWGRTMLTQGKVLRAVPNESFSISWADSDWEDTTELSVSFTSIPEGTRLLLIHKGWELLGENGLDLQAACREGWVFLLANLSREAVKD